MHRRFFLRSWACAFGGLAFSDRVLARVDGSSVERFIDVVRLIDAQWYDRRRTDIVPMAFEAAGGRRSEFFAQVFSSRVADDLRTTVRQYSGGDGDAAIARLVKMLDPWSAYLAPAEWRQYEQSLADDYSGVGMDLEKESDGSFTCWPYPGSAADQAGIRAGAKLLSVNQRSVEGRSIYAIGSMIRGRRGSPVTLGISKFGVFTSSINILRIPAHSQTVFENAPRAGAQSLRITRFASTTPAELARRMETAKAYTVELDLSGCRGGDLDSAVSVASMFMEPGSRVATIQRRTGEESLRASGRLRFRPRVLLRQDGDSASAAEVVIAALVQNGIARSYGSTTHGKATTQDVINLGHGGALVLTTGLIHGPGGGSWQGHGLAPHGD